MSNTNQEIETTTAPVEPASTHSALTQAWNWATQGIAEQAATVETPETAPALWRPHTARLWSLLFTWGFGSFLHAQNWKALGDEDRAKRSMLWFYGAILFLVFFIFLPNSLSILLFVGGVTAMVWWCVRESELQVQVVKQKYGDQYELKTWGKPLGIGAGCLVMFILVAEMSSGNMYISRVKNGKLTNTKITIGEAVEGFFGNPKWDHVRTKSGLHYVGVTGVIQQGGEDVVAYLQFQLIPETGAIKVYTVEIDDRAMKKLLIPVFMAKIYEDQ